MVRFTTGRSAKSHTNLARDLPPSEIYDTDYFLSRACDGLSEYLAGSLSVVKQKELALLNMRAGHQVLDLGCGRGESVAEMTRRGAQVTAMDYSADAVSLTHNLMAGKTLVTRADATALPFPDRSFDRVLMADVIEHLPWAMGVKAVQEIRRVLRPGGTAVVHTSPNTWFILTMMRPVMVAMRILGRAEVLSRFDSYQRLRAAMHPNEFNPLTLRRLMREAGIPARVWVDRDILRSGASEWTENLSQSRLVRVLAKVIGSSPLRLVLGNDLYAMISPAISPEGR